MTYGSTTYGSTTYGETGGITVTRTLSRTLPVDDPHIAAPEGYAAGESLRLEFETVGEDGTAIDLSEATPSWYLLPRLGADSSEALVSDSLAGVTAEVVDATAGRVDVTVDQDVTGEFGGQTVWQRLVVDDSGAGKQLWRGSISVHKP